MLSLYHVLVHQNICDSKALVQLFTSSQTKTGDDTFRAATHVVRPLGSVMAIYGLIVLVMGSSPRFYHVNHYSNARSISVDRHDPLFSHTKHVNAWYFSDVPSRTLIHSESDYNQSSVFSSLGQRDVHDCPAPRPWWAM
jgi:hypothetical protein